jgi:hypothetical protein
MATCFGVFIYAIIRPVDVEVNIKLHCAKGGNLKLTSMSAGLMMAYTKTPKHVAM